MSRANRDVRALLEGIVHVHKGTIIDVGTAWVINTSAEREYSSSSLISLSQREFAHKIATDIDLRRVSPEADDVSPIKRDATWKETHALVEEVLNLNMEFILKGNIKRRDKFIEYVTSLRANQQFHISTLLRSFLSFRIGLMPFLSDSPASDAQQLKINNLVEECYTRSIFSMSDVYVSKLHKELIQQKELLSQSTKRMESNINQRIETGQVFLEHMASVTALNQLAQKFTTTSTEDDLLHETALALQRILGFSAAQVDLLTREKIGLMHYKLDAGNGCSFEGHRQLEPSSLVREVMESGKTCWCNDVKTEEDPRWSELADPSMRSILLVAVNASSTPLGVMVLLSETPNHFNQRIRLLAEQLGMLLGTSIALRRASRLLRNSLERSDSLLETIFPQTMANRMKSGERDIVDRIDCAGVFFCDLVDFTSYVSLTEPETTLKLLKQYFVEIELLCLKYQVEKIKTIGDAFMAVSGISITVEDPVATIADFAISVLGKLQILFADLEVPLRFRIGIHAGPLIAGVLGETRTSFDVWGDTVNVAWRLQAHASPGEIGCSQAVCEKLSNRYDFMECGTVQMKGKGEQPMWNLRGRKGAA